MLVITLVLSGITLAALLVALIVLPRALQRAASDSLNRSEQNIRAEINSRLDATRAALDSRLDQTRLELTASSAETRAALERRLETLTVQNAEKLDQMRQTVDEKLQSTLEKRLGESHKLVGETLEKVIESLGEMQSMASNVDSLKRVLANVKTRGMWGEAQLEALLQDILQADQYGKNVRPNPRSPKTVEFAVKLPGRDENGDNSPLWLPVDAKFPLDSYDRLCRASEESDAVGVEQSGKELEAAIEKSARDIRDKYIAPPHTTDFALLFLPTEGLYAEIMRRPGFADNIRHDHKVIITGPSTLAALLSSLRMGFQTLMVQRKTAEIGKTLREVKAQFGQFDELLRKVQRKLEEAGNAVGEATDRHRKITNRLSKVEELDDDNVGGDGGAAIP
ncbi:MAG: DNA recombination protein RmuC [Kiritimatiellaeota bacterium]|nr:DNA recombination protein RmuC [Kiritimatiellota bacterium]